MWSTYAQTEVLPIAGATAFANRDLLADLEIGGSGVGVIGGTVVRIRGDLAIDWTGGAVADRVDIGVVVDTIDQIGVSAPADSLVDLQHREWMYLMRFFPDTAGGAVGQQVYHLDLRAKRRLRGADDRLLLCFRHVTGAGTLKIQPFIRTLVALP